MIDYLFLIVVMVVFPLIIWFIKIVHSVCPNCEGKLVPHKHPNVRICQQCKFLKVDNN